jgi:Mn2+/Fe2+ NRAMP family transporter
MSDPNQGDVMEGMIAFNCDKDSVLPAVGIVGAVIMP